MSCPHQSFNPIKSALWRSLLFLSVLYTRDVWWYPSCARGDYFTTFDDVVFPPRQSPGFLAPGVMALQKPLLLVLP